MKLTFVKGYEQETGTYFAYAHSDSQELAYASSKNSMLEALEHLARKLARKLHHLHQVIGDSADNYQD